MVRILVFLFLFIANFVLASEQFINAIENKKWDVATQTSDPDHKILALWLKIITSKKTDFYELTNFINKYPHWPKKEQLIIKVEEIDFSKYPKEKLLEWFKIHPPRTDLGQKKYIQILNDEKLKKHYIKSVWENASFSIYEERKFLKDYKLFLTDEMFHNRVRNLLFKRKIEEAERIVPYLSNKDRAIYQNRIVFQKNKSLSIIKYQKDIGILFDLANYYEDKKDEDRLVEVLKKSIEIDNKHQVYFWPMKAKLIRKLIKNQEYQAAYDFAKSHGHGDTQNFSEAEWLAGWISLRFLNKPDQAIEHFNKMYKKVKLPISISKASYWIARGYESKKDIPNAQAWYNIAAKYPASFYGQLATCKTNNCTFSFKLRNSLTTKPSFLLKNNAFVKAAIILNNSSYEHFVKDFLIQAINNSQNQEEIFNITNIGFELAKNHLSVETAKHAYYKDVHCIESGFPMVKNIYQDHQVDKALVMALIRQESVFDHRAVSHAGAMGLMQLMPHVAKQNASDLQVKFHKQNLTKDPIFNTMLGTNHLQNLLKKYNNSIILAVAAYNAGDKPVMQWIEDNGDPRKFKNIEDIIDWIEKITFHETRSYVQRVIEGKVVYESIMKKQTKLNILANLTSVR